MIYIYILTFNSWMNNLSNKTLIFYFFQLENSKELNMTSIPNSNQPITIKDAIMALPIDLSQGQYHFRFKSELVQGDQRVLGWIDINNLGAKVPQVNGSIYIKILKTKEHNQSKLFHIEKLKKAEIIKSHSHSNNHAHQHVHSAPKVVNAQTNGQRVHPSNSNQNGNNISHRETNKNVSSPQTAHINHPKSPTTVKEPPKPTQQQQKSPNQKTSPNQSFITFEVPKEVPAARASVTATTEQKLQIFKNQFNEEQQNRENERIASIQFQQQLKKWGYTDGKKINNTTTLLATLHQIWPQWKAVSLTDMLKPEQVSVLFKKAVIKVHPDKNRNRHFKEKYLSKRIFQLLNESRKQ